MREAMRFQTLTSSYTDQRQHMRKNEYLWWLSSPVVSVVSRKCHVIHSSPAIHCFARVSSTFHLSIQSSSTFIYLFFYSTLTNNFLVLVFILFVRGIVFRLLINRFSTPHSFLLLSSFSPPSYSFPSHFPFFFHFLFSSLPSCFSLSPFSLFVSLF